MAVAGGRLASAAPPRCPRDSRDQASWGFSGMAESRGRQLAMNARQDARELFYPVDSRREPGPEHVGEGVDAGAADTDVVDRDARISRFLDRVRRVGPRIAAFVAGVGYETVADRDEEASFRRFREHPTGQVPQRSAESRVAARDKPLIAGGDETQIAEVLQARHVHSMPRIAVEHEEAVPLSCEPQGMAERVGARELQPKDSALAAS